MAVAVSAAYVSPKTDDVVGASTCESIGARLGSSSLMEPHLAEMMSGATVSPSTILALPLMEYARPPAAALQMRLTRSPDVQQCGR